jgi:phosphoribosylamine-glycine ligase
MSTRDEALAAAVAASDAAWEAYVDRRNPTTMEERRILRAASAAADQEVDRLERQALAEEEA